MMMIEEMSKLCAHCDEIALYQCISCHEYMCEIAKEFHITGITKTHQIIAIAQNETIPKPRCILSVETSASAHKAPEFINLCGMYNPVTVLHEFLNACCTSWLHQDKRTTQEAFHSPCTCLVQGSCSGKTRLALELTNHLPTIYLNLRDPSSDSPPSRTEVGADVFLSVQHEIDALVVLAAIVTEAVKKIQGKSITAEEFFRHVDNPSFWKGVKLAREKISTNMTGTDLMNGTISRMMKDAIRKLLEAVDSKNKFILIVIDDARTTLSTTVGKDQEKLLFVWRRAMSHLVRIPIFFLLLDSTSSIWDFVPVVEYDPSIRVQRGEALYPPFYDFPFLGEWPLNRTCWIDVTRAVTGCVEYRWDLFEAARYSRPWYRNFIGTEVDEEKQKPTYYIDTWKQLLSFSYKKLNPQRFVAREWMKERFAEEASMMAVLSSKFAVLPLTPIMQAELVSTHCATLQYVSPDRAVVIVSYVGDPLLVAGASHFLKDEKRLIKHLQYLRNEMWNLRVSTASNKGDVGELIVAIYLQIIKDLVTSSFWEQVVSQSEFSEMAVDTSYLIPVPFRTCLRPLSPLCLTTPDPQKVPYQPLSESELNRLDALNGLINFNSFARIEENKVLERIDLEQAIKYCCALFAPPGQTAYDLVAPLQLTVNEQPVLSVVSIQVKNWTSTLSYEKSEEYCYNQCKFFRERGIVSSDVPMIAICISANAGLNHHQEKCIVSSDGKDIYIHISRLFPVSIDDRRKLSPEVMNLLNGMLQINFSSIAQKNQNSLLHFASQIHLKDENERRELFDYLSQVTKTNAKLRPFHSDNVLSYELCAGKVSPESLKKNAEQVQAEEEQEHYKIEQTMKSMTVEEVVSTKATSSFPTMVAEEKKKDSSQPEAPSHGKVKVLKQMFEAGVPKDKVHAVKDKAYDK